MNEKALLFGRSKALVGIVTTPTPEASRVDAAGVVILNAGLLHRVGPNRIHVQMARSFADQGFPVLRFDFSGIGDSRPREGASPTIVSVIEDIREALDFMQSTTGLGRFLLVGICSGADVALYAAIREPRVVGAVLIDGYYASTPGFVVRHYLLRLLSLRAWFRLLTGQSGVWSFVTNALSAPRGRESPPPADQSKDYPTIAEYREWVRSAIARGVALLLVYTEGSPSLYHYRRSLRQGMPRGRISVENFDGSDHVFTLRTSQERIVRVISRWMGTLPSEPRGAGAGSAAASGLSTDSSGNVGPSL